MTNSARILVYMNSMVVFIVAHFFSSRINVLALRVFSISLIMASNWVSMEEALSLLVITKQVGT